VDDGLRELGHLLHAQRKSFERSVASFTQAHVLQRFVRALERRLRWQSGQLAHHPNEANRRDARDERVAFGHVADRAREARATGDDVLAVHACGSFGRRINPSSVLMSVVFRHRWGRADRWPGP
jgi:hypothetical protein